MTATRLALAAVLCAAVFVPRPADACSIAPFDIGPPPEERGFDAAESPSAPAVESAIIVEEGFADSEGCGAHNSCEGVEYRYLELKLAVPDELERVRVTYPDGTVAFNRPRLVEDGVAHVNISVHGQAPLTVTVAGIDVNGFESAEVKADVEEVDDRRPSAGCDASRAANRSLVWAALVLVALGAHRRSRRRCRP